MTSARRYIKVKSVPSLRVSDEVVRIVKQEVGNEGAVQAVDEGKRQEAPTARGRSGSPQPAILGLYVQPIVTSLHPLVLQLSRDESLIPLIDSLCSDDVAEF